MDLVMIWRDGNLLDWSSLGLLGRNRDFLERSSLGLIVVRVHMRGVLLAMLSIAWREHSRYLSRQCSSSTCSR